MSEKLEAHESARDGKPDTRSKNPRPTSVVDAVPPKWVPDCESPTCTSCGASFSAFKKLTMQTLRHHCRFCGNVFCGECSTRRARLPSQFSSYQSERVCDECYLLLEPFQEFLETGVGAMVRVVHLRGCAPDGPGFLCHTTRVVGHVHEVTDVRTGGLGARAGVKVGDYMHEISGKYAPGLSAEELVDVIKDADDEIKFKIFRPKKPGKKVLAVGDASVRPVFRHDEGESVAIVIPHHGNPLGITFETSRSLVTTRHCIRSVQPESPAANAGLRPNDEILEVFRTDVEGLLATELDKLIKSAGDSVSLKVLGMGVIVPEGQQRGALPNSQGSGEIRTLVINNCEEGLGMTFHSGTLSGNRHIVSKVKEGGPADAAGLQVHDELLRVCGVDVVGQSSEVVVTAVLDEDGRPKRTVELLVSTPDLDAFEDAAGDVEMTSMRLRASRLGRGDDEENAAS
eukprot:Rmarinus@m.23363